MVTPLVLEVGPVTVRGLGLPAAAQPPMPTVTAALDGLDEPVVLVGERPVGVDRLWASLLAGLLDGATGPVLVVCPSWWPRSRIDRVRTACGVGARALTRAAVVTGCHGRDAVLVEIADGLVAVTGAGPTRVLTGPDPAEVARAARAAGRQVYLDAPPGVPGAATVATGIRDALGERDVDAVVVDPAELATGIAAGPPGARRSGGPLLRAGAGLLACVMLGWALLPAGGPRGAGPAPAAGLVEGRVAVVVPPDWPVTRVTGGPGSRRVQVDSPADADAALHITQSHTPGADLAATADVLGRAIAEARPPGVFVDFRTDARAGGRPALTYREVRPGRVIDWSVFHDGATRIGIGCQSAPRRAESIREACLEAVRSARELSPAPRRG